MSNNLDIWGKKCMAYLKALSFTVPEAGDLVQYAKFDNKDFNKKLDEILTTARTAEVLPEAVEVLPKGAVSKHPSFRENPELIHPLNGSSLDFCNNIIWDQVGADLNSAISNLRKKCRNDNKSFFLHLWRNLPDALAANANDTSGLKEYWKIIPGHFAMPFHTIWQWAAVCSSFAAAWPNPTILLFTLSSPQEFVSSARRTQDAWAGSFIFSDLSWAAVQCLAEEYGPDMLMLPSLKEQAASDHWLSKMDIAAPPDTKDLQVAAIPNMLTAIVPGESLEDITILLSEKIKKRWEYLSRGVHEKLVRTINNQCRNSLNHLPDYDHDPVWKRQTEDFIPGLGFYWSAAKLDDPKEILKILEDRQSMLGENSLLSYIKELEKLAGSNSKHGLSYPLMTQAAGTTLTARKNLRNFDQVKEPNYKCSLCGTREVWTGRVNENSVSFTDMRKFWDKIKSLDPGKGQDKKYFKLVGRFRKGERLCPVCITKRLALEGPYADEFEFDHLLFPSTSGIASMYFRKMLLKNMERDKDLKCRLTKYATEIIKYLKKNNNVKDLFFPAAPGPMGKYHELEEIVHESFKHLDGQWFYQESIESKQAVCRETGLDENTDLKEPDAPKKSFKALKDYIKDKYRDNSELFMPSPYYAVIAMDGDKIGDWIVGKNSPSVSGFSHPELREKIKDIYRLYDSVGKATSSPMGPLFQLALSECLKNYIKHKARQIVEEKHCGKLIYAGGDDLVAFVPLPTLLECMHDIYAEFGFGEDGNSNGWNNSPAYPLPGGRKSPNNAQATGMTMSMGVVIAHHSRPLWDVMSQAQVVLKEKAKKSLGRNAFAIRIIKRSGEVAETGCKFDVDQGGIKTILPVLQKIQDAFSNKISSRIGTTLAAQKWAFDFPVGDSKIFPSSGEIVSLQDSELKRLCRQHLFKKDDKVTLNYFTSFFDLLCKVRNNEQSIKLDPWETMTSLLLTLRFLTGKED